MGQPRCLRPLASLLDEPEDYGAIVLARPARGLQAVDDGRLDVDEALDPPLTAAPATGACLGQRRLRYRRPV
jgi:hypothetical protein